MGSSNAISLFTATTSIPPAPIEVLAVSTDVPSSAPTGQPSSGPSTMPTNAPTSLDKENLDPLLDLIMPISVLGFMLVAGVAYYFYTIKRTRARKCLDRTSINASNDNKAIRRVSRRQRSLAPGSHSLMGLKPLGPLHTADADAAAAITTATGASKVCISSAAPRFHPQRPPPLMRQLSSRG